MTPKVDTFEHDIANEIRRKETTLEEVKAAAAKTTEQTPVTIPPKKTSPFTIALVALIVLSLIGLAGVAYYYFHDSLLPPQAKPVEIRKKDIPKMTEAVVKISPTLGNEIGRYVTTVEKKDKGYIISINNYSAVFAYMTRNENAYIDQLAKLFTEEVIASTTSTKEEVKPVATTTPVIKIVITTDTTPVATSTKTATSSTKTTVIAPAKKSTTTQSTTTEIAAVPEKVSTTTQEIVQVGTAVSSYFSDVTVANQNMRVYKKGNQTVVYSFVGDTTVLISDSQEGILALKNAILH